MNFVQATVDGVDAAAVVAEFIGRPAIGQEPKRVKAVCHPTSGLDEAQRGLGNVRHELNADPRAKIVVVGNGIEFMLDGVKDKNGNFFDATIQDLKSNGVDFRLCNNAPVSRKTDRKRVLPDLKIVPSGVAEAATLQSREGFVYLRP